MKKILSIMMIILAALLIFCGCENEVKVENQVENYEEIYMKVLKDEKKCRLMEANLDEKELLLSEIKDEYSMGDKEVSYAILDFDRDDKPEMVVSIGEFYLVLNYEEPTVYGYIEPLRGLQNLKEDGTFYGSGGAATGALYRATFEKNRMVLETIAECDLDYYEVCETPTTKEEFDTVMEKEFYSKKNVEFKQYSQN